MAVFMNPLPASASGPLLTPVLTAEPIRAAAIRARGSSASVISADPRPNSAETS